MKRQAFNVYIYYHGCINGMVVAETKDQAEEILRHEIEALTPEEFNERVGLMEEGSDIYEIGEEVSFPLSK